LRVLRDDGGESVDRGPAAELTKALAQLIAPKVRDHLGDRAEEDPMSTSSAEQPGSGIVTFTQQGDQALDRLAADLVAHCDGSTASIADILQRVLSADIADLADKLGESLGAGEVGAAPESPDLAARRRLGADRSTAGGAPLPPPQIGR
jgi:hypothetical protein